MKTGRQFFGEPGPGQHVTGELLDGKLVVGDIAVDGVDHPVAPDPRRRPHVVLLVTVAVGVSRLIKPVASPMFAKRIRGQQTVHELSVGLG